MSRTQADWSEFRILTKPSPLRTVAGVAIAIVGPVLATLIVQATGLKLESLPYAFMVLLATLIGRRVAGLVSVVLSTILLDVYVLPPAGFSVSETDAWALGSFAVVMLVTAQLIAWLDDVAARERAARTNMSLMVELGDALAEATDLDSTAVRAADLLVGRLADDVVIHLAEEDRIRTVAVASNDQRIRDVLPEKAPPPVGSRVGVAKVIATGEPEVYVFTDTGRARRAVERDEQFEALVASGATSIAVVPLSARARTLGAMTVARRPPRGSFTSGDVSLAEQIADRIALFADNRALVESERRTAGLNAVLQDLTASLSGAAMVDEVARTVMRQGGTAVGATSGVFCIRRDEDSVEVTESFGSEPSQIAGDGTFSLSAATPMAEVMRTTRPVILANLTERDVRYPALRNAGARVDHSLVCLPLVSRGRAVGGLALSFVPPRAFRSWEIRFFQAIAFQAAQALDRAQLYVGERVTRADAEANADRLERLLMVAYRLSRAWDRPGVAQAIVEGGVQAADAKAAALQVLDEAEGELVLEAYEGYPDDLARTFARIPLSAEFASTEAARTGRAVWISGPDDWKQLFPAGYRAMVESGQTPSATASLPLLVAGRRLGVVSLSFDADRGFSEEEKDFLLTFGGLCAQALQGALLLESREEARADAERARDRVAFLAEATRLLSSSLDYEATIRELGRLCVPDIADWVSVSVVEGQQVRQLVLTHRDPARVSAARELQSRFSFDAHAEHGVPHVIRTGESELYETIDDDFLKRVAPDPEALEALRSFKLTSAMVVPIAVHDRVLGAITLAYAESGRSYEVDDLALAESVGRRAAVAIDNARLFRDREEMSSALQRSLLPQRLPEIPGAKVAVRYIPFGEAHVVGGDFYDVFEAGNDSWGLLIGDVCGKGPEAASIVGIARHTVRGLAMLHSRPSGILHALNRAILDASPWDRFCTAAYVRLHHSGGTMRATVSLGGHLPPVLRRASGVIERVGEYGSLLGVLDDVELSDSVVDLGPGDVLVLYTDGLEDQGGPAPDLPDGDRIENLIRWAPADLGAEDLADVLVARLMDRGRTRDDAAVLVLRLTGP